jgi:sterol desaturase/sphingolipid hydroxylase (fatty acid hydroxylase superfamily)
MFLGGLLIFFTAESVFPYRRPTLPRRKRWFDNLTLTSINNVILYISFASPMAVLASRYSGDKTGLLESLMGRSAAAALVALLIMDLSLYLWHLANHKVAFLWRFHRVHHSDLNMDVSTATRFHVGELAMGTAIKALWIVMLGLSLGKIAFFEAMVLLSTQFHHSSLRVPARLEKVYWLVFVPPSMHRIHHSVIIRERDSNYGVIFSIWDRILGTLITDVDQDGIRIGIGAYRRYDELRVPQLFWMPVSPYVR